MRILGIIPARGGSKGVPRKNVKLLGEKPLIAYTIESAKASTKLTNLIVSTEDDEIARVAKEFGANVPFKRPMELAQDHTPTLPVLIHAIEYLREEREKREEYDAICILQATTPFRNAGMIDGAISLFIKTNSDTLISVQKVPHEYNPHWVFEEKEDGLLRISTGEEQIIPRRQELPPAYHRDGMLYLVKTEILLNQQSIFGKKIVGFLSEGENINIDTPEDWAKAEKFLLKT